MLRAAWKNSKCNIGQESNLLLIYGLQLGALRGVKGHEWRLAHVCHHLILQSVRSLFLFLIYNVSVLFPITACHQMELAKWRGCSSVNYEPKMRHKALYSPLQREARIAEWRVFRLTIDGLSLGQQRRRWPSIKPTFVYGIMPSRIPCHHVEL